MGWKNTTEEYGSIAKYFHWLIFLLIAGMLALGFIMVDMENGPQKFKLIGIHKSIGILILTLALIRLGWKMANVAPILPESLARLEKLAAHAGHAMLYILMIGMPISGWALSSAAGIPVSVFGWFTLPNITSHDKALAHQLAELHTVLAWVIIVVVSLHICAALLHHFYHKNNVLRRMLP